MKTDFLVIGSGAAGLSFALKAAEHGHVTLVTKGKMDECNTNYAQGGICSVTYAPDTFEKHIHDTTSSTAAARTVTSSRSHTPSANRSRSSCRGRVRAAGGRAAAVSSSWKATSSSSC